MNASVIAFHTGQASMNSCVSCGPVAAASSGHDSCLTHDSDLFSVIKMWTPNCGDLPGTSIHHIKKLKERGL